MITEKLSHGDIDIDALGDGENSRCLWDESVCAQSPTHFVVLAGHDGEASAQIFCARHYVLTLARILEVHVPECPLTAKEHILQWGELS